ncbi:MAG: hypothetical protein QF907_03945 [Nitrospinota bacterium]|jgi:hypothetical protein|nr:hypothetical protein [Nitrospinota bacterium]MDP7580374.1 hypothetical protein [Nitrospinota bacterium]HJN02191.1 hypothetical protein [Nitrospinota bacterium]|tara:strand:+ start:145 stop:303 length:159 start_codon:yes stop_codon:yes gene_type:complete
MHLRKAQSGKGRKGQKVDGKLLKLGSFVTLSLCASGYRLKPIGIDFAVGANL